MTTVRHLEKLWNSKAYGRVVRELLFGRAEQSLRIEADGIGPSAAAAMVLIRLDELNQSHTPLAGTVLRTILASQDADGGWGDAITTALCLRALFTCRGDGSSIDRGIRYLASLQKPEGIWPSVPIRRMPADAFVSAFVLFQLGREARFRDGVRLDDAIGWFESNEAPLDPEARRLWDHASATLKARATAPVARAVPSLWS